uniref:Uncharacterized protein n=1 Tax=viral metagenome TaxID=1070528 RepID=A0A6C0HSD1_9ZZZZ
MFIGEEHYCAEILEKDLEKKQLAVLCKKIDFSTPEEERSQIVGIIVRITAQLAELSFSFKKFQNTRVIYLEENITLLFYYYQNEFYVLVEHNSLARTSLLATQIGEILRCIIYDMRRPLFRSIPRITDEDIFYNNIV